MARKKSEVTEVTEEIQSVEPIVETTPEVEVTEEVVEEKPKRGRKKKVEEPAEEVKAEDTIVEEIPEVKEEPVVESEPIVEEVKEEPIEEVKPVKTKKSKKSEITDNPELGPEKVEQYFAKLDAKEENPIVLEVAEVTATSSTYTAIAKSNLYVLRLPGKLDSKIGNYSAGTKFDIIEEYKGWGKIAEGKWINLNYIEKL